MSTFSCPHCDAPHALAPSTLHGTCSACRALVFRPGSGWTVIIGHKDVAHCEHIGDTLAEANYAPLAVATGQEVMRLLPRAAAVVLDVALEAPSAFAVLEAMRADPTWCNLKAILVASVYNKTAYKRRPTSLFGANDYIEQHHIHDMLVQKLTGLLGTPVPRPAHQPRSLAQELRVRALARSIIADIALYHQAEFEAAVRDGTPQGLGTALDEGRRLLAEMVNPQMYEGHDPIGAAFTAFVEEMRRVDA